MNNDVPASVGAPPLNTDLHGHTLCMPFSVFVLMDATNTQKGRGRQCVTVNTLTRGSNWSAHLWMVMAEYSVTFKVVVNPVFLRLTNLKIHANRFFVFLNCYQIVSFGNLQSFTVHIFNNVFTIGRVYWHRLPVRGNKSHERAIDTDSVAITATKHRPLFQVFFPWYS